VASTICKSNVEWLIASRTSEVAVSCSRVSSRSRAFSPFWRFDALRRRPCVLPPPLSRRLIVAFHSMRPGLATASRLPAMRRPVSAASGVKNYLPGKRPKKTGAGADVRFGSQADIGDSSRDVRFIPESGHPVRVIGCHFQADREVIQSRWPRAPASRVS
jgi:hypothetical protein